MNKLPTDEELLDFLQELTDRKTYTGRVQARWSTTGRGWRLHETSVDGVTDPEAIHGTHTSVRRAIADMMIRESL